MNMMEVTEVTKTFGTHKALDRVSLSMPEGTVYGFLGPNGAGKTTLIRILNRITLPDSGEVLFRGRPMQESDMRDIGYLPEERGLYKKMRAGEQAMYLARLKGLDKATAYRRLQEKFQQYGILDWWHRPVEELSKGMQQKLQFIITILHRPSVLILDEPFSGFDPINANLLKDEILRLKAEGTTIVLSTHNMSSVEEICDEIALINHAKKILEGNIYDIKNRFKKHIYNVEVAEDLTGQIEWESTPFELLEAQVQPHSFVYSVKIQAGSSANDLLRLMMDKGTVASFHEVLPTMNEIFIEQVVSFNRNSQYEQ